MGVLSEAIESTRRFVGGAEPFARGSVRTVWRGQGRDGATYSIDRIVSSLGRTHYGVWRRPGSRFLGTFDDLGQAKAKIGA